MTTKSESTVRNLFVSGVLSLITRTIFIQIVSFLATLALTVFLDPSVYGVFYLVSSVVNFLAYFSDIGLAAALIQKEEKITSDDLATTFTIQQLLVLGLLLILIILSPFIKANYHIGTDALLLLYALGASLLMSSLKTVPSVLLEREIKFEKLIIPQILETLAFNLAAVFFAWRGFGISAFTYAVLLRGITGLVAMYLISPYKPQIKVSRASLNHLLKFGLPYQANSFLAVIKDDGMTIFLGKIIGLDALGFLGWGSRWANLPLRIFMDNVTKVAFPAFSRLQSDKEKLKWAIENSIKYLCLLTFPALIAMGFLALPVVHLIPRYSKWLPAIIPLYFYLFNAAWACISTLLTNTLSAIGEIKTAFKLMIMWTALTWGITPYLAFKFGYLGVSYAVGIIALSSVVVLILVRRFVKIDYLKSLKTPILATLALGLYLYFSRLLVIDFWRLIYVSLGGVLVYFLSVYLLEGRAFYITARNYFKNK